jgi:hypothetical protein
VAAACIPDMAMDNTLLIDRLGSVNGEP